MSGIDEILAGYENLRPGQEDFYRYLLANGSGPTVLPSSSSTCAAIPP